MLKQKEICYKKQQKNNNKYNEKMYKNKHFYDRSTNHKRRDQISRLTLSKQ